mmetsp:Transcript_8139/g.26008  ORF Transcript_8139/g.26008 Transcript_8139/m.26008 type:complete len:237 (-) Transcript_8139:1593-2303(-)
MDPYLVTTRTASSADGLATKSTVASHQLDTRVNCWPLPTLVSDVGFQMMSYTFSLFAVSLVGMVSEKARDQSDSAARPCTASSVCMTKVFVDPTMTSDVASSLKEQAVTVLCGGPAAVSKKAKASLVDGRRKMRTSGATVADVASHRPSVDTVTRRVRSMMEVGGAPTSTTTTGSTLLAPGAGKGCCTRRHDVRSTTRRLSSPAKASATAGGALAIRRKAGRTSPEPSATSGQATA